MSLNMQSLIQQLILIKVMHVIRYQLVFTVEAVILGVYIGEMVFIFYLVLWLLHSRN